jgi:rhodanese-related sulfurtransferase
MMTMAMRTLALAGAGLLLGLLANALRPDGVALRPLPEPVACEGESTGPRVLAPQEASLLCHSGGVVIADARSAARYTEGHIASAIHLPCDAAGRVASDAVAHFEGAKTVVVYGDSTREAQPVAASLWRRLEKTGADVVVLEGGFRAWEAAGLACVSGPCADCKETR